MNPLKIELLHSRYNSEGEAERYVNSLSIKENIRFFILVEPGLGYIIPPLKRRNPGAKIISLHVESVNGIYAPDSEWHPGMGITIQDFLESEIPGAEAADIKLIEWRPALKIFGDAYAALVAESAGFVKRLDAGFRTVKVFGRRWFSNFFKNLGLIRNIVYPSPVSASILVTGAGPGLEEVIPLISEEFKRGNLFILASSSSFMALSAHNLNPDMVLCTDGGNWAKLHIYECFRKTSMCQKAAFPLATALTAALPSQCELMPILPICDGSLWQSLILKELNIPHIILPQRGTVSAQALDLSFALTDKKVFFAGMDMKINDIRSHVKPYSFDSLLEEKTLRINPFYSQTYGRSLALNDGGSYAIYASWFEKQIPCYPKRLHPLGENNPVFNSLEKNNLQIISEKDPVKFKTVEFKHEGIISQKALAIVEKEMKKPEQKITLQKELNALIFPGIENINEEELLKTLRSLVLKKGMHG